MESLLLTHEKPQDQERSYEVRFLVVVSLLIALLGATQLMTRPAHAYSCGDATSGTHCYGITTSVSGYYGMANDGLKASRTNILVVPMQCNACGGINTTSGFIDNEMWLGDNHNPSQAYWVEVGYKTESNFFSSWEEYFWADVRPVDKTVANLNFHNWGNIPSGDYQHTDTFYAWQDSQAVNQFDLAIHTTQGGSFTGASTNNTMAPSLIQMGQELAGNAGAYAPFANYTYRYYTNSSGVEKGIYGNYFFSNNPPPSIGSYLGATGYDFATNCC